jgi:hypothetical protein
MSAKHSKTQWQSFSNVLVHQANTLLYDAEAAQVSSKVVADPGRILAEAKPLLPPAKFKMSSKVSLTLLFGR